MGFFQNIGKVLSGSVVTDAKEAYEKKVEKDDNADARENAWELEEIRNSGWKDEYILLLISLPLVMSFIPYTQQIVLDGFAILAKTPEWYRWLVLLIFTAVYGIRVWKRS